MSRSRESRPRGSRKQQTKITFAARTRTLNRFKKIIRGIRSLDSFSRVLTLSMKFSVDCSLCLDSSVRGFSTLVKYLDPVHTKTIVNANASKRKLFYAFRPSVHTKTMKTLTVNAQIRKRSPKWINLKTPFMRLRVDGRKRIFS